MSWLTHEEAIRSAFEYRWRGTKSQHPILLTDFDIKNLRVIEVAAGDWNNAATWQTSERPMSDAEFAAINAYIGNSRGLMALGEEVMQEQGQPVHVRGFTSCVPDGATTGKFQAGKRRWILMPCANGLVRGHHRRNDLVCIALVSDNEITQASGATIRRFTE